MSVNAKSAVMLLMSVLNVKVMVNVRNVMKTEIFIFLLTTLVSFAIQTINFSMFWSRKSAKYVHK